MMRFPPIQSSWYATHALRLLPICALLLSACSTFSPDGGLDAVRQQTANRLGQETAQQVQRQASPDDTSSVPSTVQDLLRQPLGVEQAVHLALLNNPSLQASYQELKISEAYLVQAGRLPNPGFSFTRLRQGEDIKIERAISFAILNLFTLPFVHTIEKGRFAQSQLRATEEVLRVAAETRKAWITAVAAQESLRYAQQVRDSAEASAELARRMTRVGNWSRLDHLREQAFYADSALKLAKAQQTATAEREKLTRLLGLWGSDTAYKLPTRLPDLPKQTLAANDLEQRALEQRLDVNALRLENQQLARALGLTKTTGFLNVLEVGGRSNTQTGMRRESGFEVSLEIPLFDWGDAKVARAEATYMESVWRLSATAIRARSEVREGYSNYRHSWDMARHLRDEVVPLRQKISQETLLRYNGMLTGVFELLADSREQVNAVNGYLDALKDFWLAEAELQQILGGRLQNRAPTVTPTRPALEAKP